MQKINAIIGVIKMLENDFAYNYILIRYDMGNRIITLIMILYQELAFHWKYWKHDSVEVENLTIIVNQPNTAILKKRNMRSNV